MDDFGEILDSWERSRNVSRDSNYRDKDEQPEPAGASLAEGRRLLEMAPEKILDLHGLDRAQAARTLSSFLDECRRGGVRKVLIIHGKGMHGSGPAVLPRLVRDTLETHPAAGRFGLAERRFGGNGATWVIIRKFGVDRRGDISVRGK
jgi:DNA-nicking Smr family endonuclease